jgi:hypothetical protein
MQESMMETGDAQSRPDQPQPCPCVQRAVIVLSEKSIPHDRWYINLADKPD